LYTVATCWIFFVNYTMMHGSMNIKSLHYVTHFRIWEKKNRDSFLTNKYFVTGYGTHFA